MKYRFLIDFLWQWFGAPKSPLSTYLTRSLLFLTLFLCGLNAGAQTQTYVFATYTYSTNTRLKHLEPLTQYLSAKTGHSFVVRSYPTVQALIQGIAQDSVDFAMINTLGYLTLQHKHPELAKPVLTLDLGDATITHYGGCIIARKDAPFTSLKDLINATDRLSLGLVNSSSTSGNLVPRLLLNQEGFEHADSSFRVSYRGTHKTVVEDVLAGKIQLGGCGCAEVDSARKYLAFDQKATVLGAFHDIPLGPVIHHREVPKQVVRDVVRALNRIHEDNFTILEQFSGGWTEFREARRFKKVRDRDYNSFRRLFGKNKFLWQMIE
ncbi:MAG TPA: PhnD/SsuA/transferrin family substrate-binding protein [Saprospiraceae bacterium]|nr:PhnD/SsuA/transferrin family substrate-binding protein [Saprospiraceae bacterium]